MNGASLNTPLLVLANVPEQELAVSLAKVLVERSLAACVNIMPAVSSIYRWQGKIEHTTEIPLLIKTTQARYLDLQQAIVAAHPYDVPEIIALPIAAGLPAYLDWIADATKKPLQI